MGHNQQTPILYFGLILKMLAFLYFGLVVIVLCKDEGKVGKLLLKSI